MSKTLSVPRVAEIVRARGLATLDVETSHKVVRAVVTVVRSMSHDLNADALNLAVSVLCNADRLPSGCTPVPTDAWRRIWACLPDEARDADAGMTGAELVASWLEGRAERDVAAGAGYTPVLTTTWDRISSYLGLTEGTSHTAVAEATESLAGSLYSEQQDAFALGASLDALRADLAEALGVEGDPEAHDLVGTVREMGDAVRAARSMLEEARGALESRDAEIARLRAEVDRVTADRDRLVEIADRHGLDATSCDEEDDDGRGGGEVAVESLGLDGPPVEAIQRPEPVDTGRAGASMVVERPPAVVHGDNPPVPDDFPGRGKEPVRVSLAPAAPRPPTVEDKVAVVAMLAQGVDKASIARALGIRSAMVVNGMSLHLKREIERVRRAAPHDVEGVLAEIRREMESKAVASA